MKVLCQWPNPTTVYAGRTIANGYRNAFTDLGHTFKFLQSSESSKDVFESYKPDIFITALNSLHLKFLDLAALEQARKRGMRVFVNIPFWSSPLSLTRMSESGSLKNNSEAIQLIRSGHYGDLFYNVCEEGDERMEGFSEATGYSPKTLLLAADKTLIYPEYSDKFVGDISYIGTNLPEKNAFFQQVIFPLRSQYSVKIYGQDWTLPDRFVNTLQKGGQYLNIPFLQSIRKPKMNLEDERKVYTSSTISINVHEQYQLKYGDLNERTFKIPLANGFEIVDDVPTLKKYFTVDKEMIIATSREDWWEKIQYYITYPEKRLPIIKAAKKRVEKHHTYHNRVETMLEWYRQLSN